MNATTWVVGGVLGTIVGITMGICLWLFLRKSDNPKIKRLIDGVGSWEWENLIFITIAFVFFWTAIRIWNKEWYDQYVWNDEKIWALNGMLIFFLWLAPKGTKPIRHTVGKWGAPITAIVILYMLFGSQIKEQWSSSTAVQARPARSGAIPTTAPARLSNNLAEIAEGCDGRVQDFWRQQLPDLPGNPRASRMIEHAWLESNCRQFQDDGKVTGNAGSSAVGVMQIMQSIWAEDALKLGYDLATLEGNLNFAYWLYEKREREGKVADIDWAETTPEKVQEVTAPVGERSKPISVLRAEVIDPEDGGTITIWDDQGRPHRDDGGKQDPINTFWVQFESNGSEPVKVTVNRP